MRLLAPVSALAASVLLFACAAPKPRFEGLRKCYLLDSTDHVSRDDYAAMFRASIPAGDSLAPCDSVRGPRLRIRPTASTVPGMAPTWWLLGAQAAAAGAGAGLTLALDNGLYLLAPAPLLPLSPMARAEYLIEYKDSAGAKHQETLEVRRAAWFNDRADSRREILEASQHAISNRLFGAGHRDGSRRSLRLSLEPVPLIAYDRNDAVIVSPHFERLLPANFSMEFSPTLNVPLSGGFDGYAFSLYLGPRHYFLGRYLGRHAGPFIGLQPYGAVGHDDALYGTAGLPAMTGFVWQGWRFSLALELGGGPVYRWGGPESDFGWVALGGVNVGAAF